jgi:hypothetical protein
VSSAVQISWLTWLFPAEPSTVVQSGPGALLLSLNFQGQAGSKGRPVWARRPVMRSGRC